MQLVHISPGLVTVSDPDLQLLKANFKLKLLLLQAAAIIRIIQWDKPCSARFDPYKIKCRVDVENTTHLLLDVLLVFIVTVAS